MGLEEDCHWPRRIHLPVQRLHPISCRYRRLPWSPVRSQRHHHVIQPIRQGVRCCCHCVQVHRRIQMESDQPMEKRMYKGNLDCAAKVLKTEGFGGMYKGALANVFRGVGASLVLVLYGEIKLALERGKEEAK